jgi:cytochrome c-type biogenesis protein CcmH
MTLWFVLVMMTAAAIFAVLWPLSRQTGPAGRGRSGSDLAVYRDQLDEIDRDLAARLIGKQEAEAARVEVSRRLIAAADAAETRSATPQASALWRRRAISLVALIILPLSASALYLAFGSPGLPGMPLASRNAQAPETRSIESMVAQVEAHLERNPEDGQGWEVLAPVYMRAGRFTDAVRARSNALRLLGSTADREADLGEAMVAAANGVVTAEAKNVFERVLAMNASDVKARYYTGLAAEQDGKPLEAARIWRDVLAKAPPNAPYRPLIQDSLARVDPAGAPVTAPAGPSAGDVAAAQELTPDQRSEMIRGMVDRLSERLKTDGSDLDGWLRLMRAYIVLGEPEKARIALADARKAVGEDADKRKTLDDFAKGLGIEG